MRSAEDPAVVHRGRPALPAGHDVVDLQTHRRAAHTALGELPLALRFVALHDLALHLRRHAGLPLRLLLDEQFQRRRQHLLVGRAGVAVGLSRFRLPEQRQELAGDGDVQPALRGGHRDDHRPGRVAFTQVNFLASVCPGCCLLDRLHPIDRLDPGNRLHSRHHRPFRYRLSRPELRRHLQGLLLRESVEPGQDLRPVLLGHHSRQDRRGGEAEPSVLDRVQHFREPLQQPGRGAPVVGGTPGELQSPVEVVEERCVSQVPVRPAAVELRESEEKGTLRQELRSEEAGEVGVKGTGVEGGKSVHATTLSPVFATSWNAQISPPRRFRSRRSPNLARRAVRRSGAKCRCGKRLPRAPRSPEREIARIVSTPRPICPTVRGVDHAMAARMRSAGVSDPTCRSESRATLGPSRRAPLTPPGSGTRSAPSRPGGGCGAPGRCGRSPPGGRGARGEPRAACRRPGRAPRCAGAEAS